MSIFGGGQAAASTPQIYIGIPVQTSIKGSVIPRGWGTFKCGCNMLDYLDFSQANSTSAGGKGGSYQSTTDSYSATMLLGICRGPIAGIRTIWKDQSTFVNGATTALAQAGLSAALGSLGQTPWPYLTSAHPTHAIGYSLLAYAYAENYALNDSATSPNHSFEVQSNTRAVVSGATLDDANPADILTDFFSDMPQWSTSWLASLTDYGNYCLAAGLLLSPVLDSQRQVSDFLTEILTASNSDCVWSDGQLKIMPYGDTEITGNGVTWTPDLTPDYELEWSDFLADDGDDPIQWDFKRPAEAYNICQVEFLDRTSSYNSDVVPGVDQANIDQYGQRKQDPTSLHSICDPAVAATVVQLMVQRTCNVRRTATFTLPEVFGLLDPMDKVTVPLRNGGRRFVRIVDYTENPSDGSIQYDVEEMLVGVSHAALYSRQGGAGSAQNQNTPPGDACAPAIFDVPVQLAQVLGLETWLAVNSINGNAWWGGCEVWVSTDPVNYVKKTTITGGSRVGVLTATLPTGSDPDTVNTLSVDLSASMGELESGSASDANTGTTLCYVDGEYVSYEQATLTSAFHYDLGKSGSTAGMLRRGMWGSGIASHASGSLFVRLDDSVCKLPYTPADVGRTIYIKLLSFNIFGKAKQQLSAVTAYTHTIGGPPTQFAASGLTVTAAIRGNALKWTNPANFGIARTEVWRSATSAFSGATHIGDAAGNATTYNDQNATAATTYWYWIRPVDLSGNEGIFYPTNAGAGVSSTTDQAQTADIAALAVTTGNIAANAVTNSSVSAAAGVLIGTSFTTLTSITKTLTGGNVQVGFTDYCTWSTAGPRGFYQIVNDLGTVVLPPVGFGGGTCPDFLIVAGGNLDTNGATGVRTYYLQAKYVAGNQPTSQLPNLVINELKK